MKIYTKTGDKGETSLFGGKRVPKDDVRVEAYGTVDELNSNIGLLMCYINQEKSLKFLQIVQNELFVLGSLVAADPGKSNLKLPPFKVEAIKMVESEIDMMDTFLEPLKFFVLPGGSKGIAMAHVCRTICRRAERRLVSLNHLETVNLDLVIYLNRLSDYFFTLSRYIAQQEGISEKPWIPEK
ncbi:MAG: cob(I)yrinic acid a,c-diamide adenosyltransferase [Saprospiraceae bacterium]|nr:cob(I)yrinic acid a,c-diamide adenosyltransferase [Candidatus Vicinibacter affinis]MBK7305107.1 cob(I)yrinic acid a,c-diamide adenosyltransferase [Candidatus Vicinibacter affinis]MBK8403704.1 cob(I)yrinic acid a,c-diamide adenosyltransferase [Candidatus Vicinibacter affinis]MBK8642989.1 cob(I)yrinic acid a,c-diamide adenosyltransferase [Candidatus Vicinibacter affinis]